MATPKTISSDFLSTSAASVLTAAANKRYRIKELEFHNTDSSAIQTRVWLAPNNAGNLRTVSDDDRYQKIRINVPAGESLYFGLGWTIDAENDSIQARAATGSKVTVSIHYIEEATA
jgi:hypothetical protein